MVRYEPANSIETQCINAVRTFIRLPNVQYLENPDATIVGAYPPGTGVPGTGGLTSRELPTLARGLVAMDIVEVVHSLDHTNVTSMAAVRIIMDAVAFNARSK